jgi:hypothetical protein
MAESGMRRREFLVATAALAAACGRPADRPAAGAGSRAALPGAATPHVLLVDAGASFAAFLGEMLGAEGVIGVVTHDAASASPEVLITAGAVAVHGAALSPAWIDGLEAFVRRGGLLVAVAPGAPLLGRFGIEEGGALAATGVQLAHRADDESPLRLHVAGQRWTPAPEAAVEATFAGDIAAPAAVRVTHGDGQAVLWAFDVAHNVALIRQGNPAWADTNRDDLPQQQVVDAMVGWIRPETLARPDADLYQQAVSAALAGGTGVVGPAPLLDYFPGAARSVLVATSDAHGNGAAVLDALVRRVEGLDGRLSIYYTPPATTGWRLTARRARWTLGRLPVVGDAFLSDLGPPSPQVVDSWRARGHEFAPHPRADEGVDLESGLAQAWQEFDDDGYGTTHLSTRTHKILWSGWVGTAQAQRRRGVRMNLDAYHLGPALRRADGGWAHGHVIGSGLPLRFVDESGTLVDCYQQPTQIVDEHLVGEFGGIEDLSPEDAVMVATEIVREATTGAPAALCGQFHADGFVGTPARIRAAEILLDGTLAACRTAGVPVWTAERWIAFLDARRAVVMTARSWQADSGRLTTSVALGPDLESGMSVLLPAEVAGRTLARVTVGGAAVATESTTRGGREWARVLVAPGVTEVVAEYRPG